jgi:AraC-like DNA-binding protein
MRELSPLIARISAAVTDSFPVSWEEMSLRLLSTVVHAAAGLTPRVVTPSTSALARVTEIVRAIEEAPGVAFSIGRMAQDARMSPYHFLRTFRSLTGVTPHQYVRRVRLRHAATRLASERAKVIDVAFDSGFGDVSNFNRAFRAEFGVSPTRYRAG